VIGIRRARRNVDAREIRTALVASVLVIDARIAARLGEPTARNTLAVDANRTTGGARADGQEAGQGVRVAALLARGAARAVTTTACEAGAADLVTGGTFGRADLVDAAAASVARPEITAPATGCTTLVALVALATDEHQHHCDHPGAHEPRIVDL